MKRRSFLKLITSGSLAGFAGLVGLKVTGAPVVAAPVPNGPKRVEFVEHNASISVRGSVWETNHLGAHMWSKRVADMVQRQMNRQAKQVFNNIKLIEGKPWVL